MTGTTTKARKPHANPPVRWDTIDKALDRLDVGLIPQALRWLVVGEKVRFNLVARGIALALHADPDQQRALLDFLEKSGTAEARRVPDSEADFEREARKFIERKAS